MIKYSFKKPSMFLAWMVLLLYVCNSATYTWINPTVGGSVGGLIGGGSGDRIIDSTKINFNGGTLGFIGDVTETLGTLSLDANSSIDLSNGNISIIFDTYGIFAANQELRILNWTDTDMISFNTPPTLNELRTIKFINPYGNEIDLFGEWNVDRVVPIIIPEPLPYYSIILILLIIFIMHIKK